MANPFMQAYLREVLRIAPQAEELDQSCTEATNEQSSICCLGVDIVADNAKLPPNALLKTPKASRAPPATPTSIRSPKKPSSKKKVPRARKGRFANGTPVNRWESEQATTCTATTAATTTTIDENHTTVQSTPTTPLPLSPVNTKSKRTQPRKPQRVLSNEHDGANKNSRRTAQKKKGNFLEQFKAKQAQLLETELLEAPTAAATAAAVLNHKAVGKRMGVPSATAA